jgi:hypothetical protein
MKNNMNRREVYHYLLGSLDTIHVLIASGKFNNEELEKYRIMYNMRLDREIMDERMEDK